MRLFVLFARCVSFLTVPNIAKVVLSKWPVRCGEGYIDRAEDLTNVASKNRLLGLMLGLQLKATTNMHAILTSHIWKEQSTVVQ